MEASLLFYVLRTLLPHDPAVPQGDDMVGVGGHLWIMRDQAGRRTSDWGSD